MLPGLPAGWIQDHLGYVRFFIWVCIATIPSFVATALIKVEANYGRKMQPLTRESAPLQQEQ
jgi:PAT family beta-lactamase induction signal transducer AmpG